MTSTFLSKAESLRQEAWRAVLATREYAVFAAIDAAVVASGGATTIADISDQEIPTYGGLDKYGPIKPRSVTLRPVSVHAFGNSSTSKRISQGDAAELALIRAERPQSASDLLHGATNEGASIGGEKPLVNFTSSLSKDKRFYSFRKNGMYYWWLHNVALPPEWNETEPDEFDGLLGSASSLQSSQEGGDGHGPATT